MNAKFLKISKTDIDFFFESGALNVLLGVQPLKPTLDRNFVM